MGSFWDRILGKPDAGRFAEEVRLQFKQRGVAPLTYHAAQNELGAAGDKPAIYYLGNVFSDYARVPKGDRARIMARFVEAMASAKDELPSDYAAARPRLMPIIRTESENSSSKLHLIRSGHPAADVGKLDPARRRFVDDLVIGLAYDTPHSMQRLNFQHLKDWNVTFDQALADALENLRGLPEHGGWKKLDGGVWSGEWGDSYESSRLLLPDLIHRLGVDEPVACVPLREVLLVASARDPAALAEMARLSRTLVESRPRWLGAKPLRLVAGQWQLFEPAGCLEAEFGNVEAIVAAGACNDQKECLEAIYEREQTDVFVAKVLLFKNEAGRISSVATWTEGVDTLLPMAGRIMFNRRVGDSVTSALVPWRAAWPIVSALVEATDLVPLRYRVRAFPDEATWAALVALSERPAADP